MESMNERGSSERRVQGAGEQDIQTGFFFDTIASSLLVLLFFLTPLFFVPNSAASLSSAKFLLLGGVLGASFVFWVIGRLKEGVITFPHSSFFVFAAAIPIVYFLSSFFSEPASSSFLGRGMEEDTFAAAMLLYMFFILSAMLLHTRTRMLATLLATLFSFGVLAFFLAVRFFVGDSLLSFGIFNDLSANPVGKWNDLGIFLGLIALLSLTGIEFLPFAGRVFKIFLGFLLILSLFFLSIVDFYLAWHIFGFFAFAIFLHGLFFGAGETSLESKTGAEPSSGRSGTKRFRLVSFIVLVLCLFFIFGFNPLTEAARQWGNIFPESSETLSRISIPYIEATPSLQGTFFVAERSLMSDFQSMFFGAGPNTFGAEWLMGKPKLMNEHENFWNADFNSGFSHFFTILVTIGIIGGFAWAFFFVLFAKNGFRALGIFFDGERRGFYPPLFAFLPALYLWAFVFLYLPNIAILALCFGFTGLFLGTLSSERLIGRFRIFFLRDARVGFLAVSMLIACMVFVYMGGASIWHAFRAESAYGAGRVAFYASGDIGAAEEKIHRALFYNKNDLYYRELALLSLARIEKLLVRTDISEDDFVAEFEKFLGNAIALVEEAKRADPEDYQNYIAEAEIYALITPLGIEGARESALKAYEEAAKRNPQSPVIPLSIARLYIQEGDTASARDYIQGAIILKSNYTDAFLLLSQIEASEGDLSKAIEEAERAAVAAPGDPLAFFNLGFLLYSNGDFSGAISALEGAVSLQGDYANARYFLGLSYEKAGRTNDAIRQFAVIEELNPDNAEIKRILENLRAGRGPFSDPASPVVPSEERETLPVPE